MRRHFLIFVAVVCLLSVQNTHGQQTVPAQKISATPAADMQTTFAQAGGVAFHVLSFSEALEGTGAEDKLLLIDCFTTWYGPCKRLSKVVSKGSLITDYFSRHFVNSKMDMEKDEGVELRRKYGIHMYPTFLFISSSGGVVYRLIGAEDAPKLLKRVKLGIKFGGLSGLKRHCEIGDRDSAFIYRHVSALSATNRKQEVGKVTADSLQGREQRMLESEDYFLVFCYYVHSTSSSAFQYAVNHQREIADKFLYQGVSLDHRLLEDWATDSYAYLAVGKFDHCTFDERGLDTYVAKMEQVNVVEADMIGGSLHLNRDDIMKQWDSLVKHGDEVFASHTILGDEGHLLQQMDWLDKGCADMSSCEETIQWYDKVYKELIKRSKEIKKNLPPGAIPVISMIDHKGQLLQVAEKLRELIQQS